MSGLVKVLIYIRWFLLLIKTTKTANLWPVANLSIEKFEGAWKLILFLPFRPTYKLIEQVTVFLALHTIGAPFSASFQELALKGFILKLFDLRVVLIIGIVQVGLFLLPLLVMYLSFLSHDTWINTNGTPVKSERLSCDILRIQWSILLKRAFTLLLSLFAGLTRLLSWQRYQVRADHTALIWFIYSPLKLCHLDFADNLIPLLARLTSNRVSLFMLLLLRGILFLRHLFRYVPIVKLFLKLVVREGLILLSIPSLLPQLHYFFFTCHSLLKAHPAF